jgi:virginiamycin B lyase
MMSNGNYSGLESATEFNLALLPRFFFSLHGDVMNLVRIFLIMLCIPLTVIAASKVQPKMVVEYPLPGAGQTHELIAVNNEQTIIISQITSSTMVKVTRNSETGNPEEAARFTIGSANSGLHGLRVSEAYPGKIWATLQFDSKLLLIDPNATDPKGKPVIVKTIDVPAPGRGPHVVVEYGDELWVTLKDSNHVLRINHKEPSDYVLYPSSRKPIFVAKHASGRFYASQDQSSQILSINPRSGKTREIDIPMSMGATPVGLVTGPDGNVWFVLAGSSAGGTGTFGKIDKDGEITWFHLNTALGKTSGLLHLAFENTSANQPPTLYLLGSSIVNHDLPDAIFTVTFDQNYSAIDTQTSTIFPSQKSWAHRVIVTQGNLFATELKTSILVQIPTLPRGELPVDEDADSYASFGLGVKEDFIQYSEPF